jgi:two-component system response regulator GlrR
VEGNLGLNLLYVEDNPDLREVISAALTGEGYDVDVAACADEGLRRLRERRFDLVISDYALPDHTGAWMLREAAARGLLECTEALIVTANPHPLDAGDIPVMEKPLDMDRLLAWVGLLLDPERTLDRA